MLKKLLSILLCLAMLTASTAGAMASETDAPVQPMETSIEEPAAPVEEPTAPVEEPAAPTEEPTAPIEEPAAPVEEPAAPVEEPAAPVEEPAAPVEEPTAPVDEPAEAPTFTKGLVRLPADTVLYTDEALTQEQARLATEGIAYAELTEQAVKLLFTTDGLTEQTAYVAAEAITALTEDEAASATETLAPILVNGLSLFTLAFATDDNGTMSNAPEPPEPPVLVLAKAGTIFYADEAQTQKIGTLAEDGVVLREGERYRYAVNSAATELASLSEAPNEPDEAQLAEYAQREGGLAVGETKLFPLVFMNYTMETYGFPGMPEDYRLSAANSTQKAEITSKGLLGDIREKMTAGEDYVENRILAYADSRDEAELIAASYAGELETFYDYGLAVIQLQNHTTLQAMNAAADPRTSLVPVYADHIYTVEPPHYDAPDGSKTEKSISALSALPSFGTWATQKTNDPFLQKPDDETHLHHRYANITSGYQYMHDVVDSFAAWPLTKGAGVRVAIIDTGVYSAHADLPNVVDMLTSSDASAQSISNSTVPSEAHGSHVAGIIAGIGNNGIGGSGIAPAATLLAYRCSNNEDKMKTSYITTGLNRAIQNDAWVVNMSLGGSFYDLVFDNAVQSVLNAGIAVFASEGNDGMQTYNYPAHFSGVISVASVDNNFARSFYSTYASATISAPGSNILSSAWNESGSPASAYQSYDGTSMACPVAVGCAALYYSAIGTQDLNGDGAVNRDDVETLRKQITANASKLQGSAVGMGAGVINIANMLASILLKPTIMLSESGSTVSNQAVVSFTGSGNGGTIVYTLDGKNPSVKNGEIAYGTGLAMTLDKSGGSNLYKASTSLMGCPVGKCTIKALYVNTQGKVSAVATKTVTLDNLYSTSVAINESTHCLGNGKKITLTATLTPTSKTLKPTWQIVSGGEFATLTVKNGVATLLGKSAGTVVVKALSTNRDGLSIESAPYSVLVEAPVKTVVLNGLGKTLECWSVDAPIQLSPTITLEDGNTASSNSVTFASSKPAVATVNPSGLVTLVGAGTTSITCAALDGSGKKASVTLKVKQAATGVSIVGNTSAVIASGKKLTLKPAYSPAAPVGAKVKSWSVDDASASRGITISGGVLNVPTSVTNGEVTVTLKATQAYSTDELTATLKLTVVPSQKSMQLTSSDDRVVRNAKNVITSASIFTMEIPATARSNDSTIQFGATLTDRPIEWSSSKESVATVNNAGLVTAVAKGTTVITAKTVDGTNLKASVKVNVDVPVSTMTVYTDTSKLKRPYASIAFGKTRAFSVTFGDTYGVPTNKKLNWTFELREYNTGAFNACYYDMDNTTYYTRITDPAILSKISVKNGKVSIKASLEKNWQVVAGRYFVKITATAQDGTGAYGFTYAELACTSSVRALPGKFLVYYRVGNTMNSMGYASSTLKVSAQGNSAYLYFSGYCFNNDFGASSSKPSVASPIDSISSLTYNGYDVYAQVGTNSFEPLYRISYKGDTAGKATIKVFTNDGTNKSASFSVTVK